MNKMRNILFLSLILAAPVLGTPNGEVKRVVLRPEAETAGPRVLLGDVADVVGFSEEWQRRLTALDVGSAALPGESRQISRLRVETMVGSEYGRDDVYVLGPGKIDVITRARTLSGAEVMDAVRSHIDSHSPWTGDKVKIEFRPIDDKLVVPDRNLSFRIEPVGDCDFIGYSMFNLLAEENGRTAIRIPVSCDIRVFRPVLVSRDRIDREQPLDGDNLSLEERELGDLRGTPISGLDKVAGQVATRIISPGRILTDDMIGPPVVIQRGDRVQIEALTGRIMIRLSGEADQAGRPGEMIAVRNPATGKRLQARVIDDKRVQIVF